MQVSEASGEVVDDCFVGAIEAGQAAAYDERAVHGAEGVDVGRREGVDGAELFAGLVG